MMKGYRTLGINAAAIILAIAASWGIVLDPEMVSTAVVGILALVNIGLRFITDSKVGEK